ncbi:hypothetical protein TWF281_002740 [Arthrobotrys megalospora]
MNYGVNPVDTVAIQCLVGRSADKYLALNSSIDIAARYDGMKRAFNDNKDYEILVPVRKAGRLETTPLTAANYDALVEDAIEKMEFYGAREGRGDKPGVDGSDVEGQNDVEPFNRWLSIHLVFPVWQWGRSTYGRFITCFMVWGGLGPLPTLAVIKWAVTGKPPLEFIFFFMAFALTQVYSGFLLDVGRREICYIRARKNNMSPERAWKWEELYRSSLPGKPANCQEALDDIQRGRVRRDDDGAFAVPVMAVKPLVEFNMANWLLFYNPLRQIFLSACGIAFEIRPEWAIAYAAVGIFQAHLQKVLVEKLLGDAQTTHVHWFRRLPGYEYKEIQKGTWIL